MRKFAFVNMKKRIFSECSFFEFAISQQKRILRQVSSMEYKITDFGNGKQCVWGPTSQIACWGSPPNPLKSQNAFCELRHFFAK